MRVEPPTRMTLSNALPAYPAIERASWQTAKVRSTRGAARLSTSLRVMPKVRSRWAPPIPNATTSLRESCAWSDEESSTLRCSAATRPSCSKALGIGPGVAPVGAQEGFGNAFGDGGVEVVAAEERVARGRQDLEDGPRELQEGAVECAAAEVVHRDPLVLGPTEAVCEGSRRRLVDDAQHFEAGDATGDLRGGPLELVEVGGDGDDGAVDRLAEPAFGDGPRPLEDEGADLRKGVLVAAHDDERAVRRAFFQLERVAVLRTLDLFAVPRPADEPLDAGDGVPGVDDASLFGLLSDQDFAVRRKRDDARQEAPAVGVGEHAHVPRARVSDHGVGRSKVDPDDGHRLSPCSCH